MNSGGGFYEAEPETASQGSCDVATSCTRFCARAERLQPRRAHPRSVRRVVDILCHIGHIVLIFPPLDERLACDSLLKGALAAHLRSRLVDAPAAINHKRGFLLSRVILFYGLT